MVELKAVQREIKAGQKPGARCTTNFSAIARSADRAAGRPSLAASDRYVGSVPTVSGTGAIRALKRVGFALVRQRGSHVTLKHTDGRGAVVPKHKELRRGTLGSVLKQAKLHIGEFLEQLR